MKAILMSIKAEHNANIEAFKKLLEIRKRIPKCDLPIKVYTYESGKKGRHKVTNEWVCDEIISDVIRYKDGTHTYHKLLKGSCLTAGLLSNYGNWEVLYGLHISNLKVYDKPRELWEFSSVCNKTVGTDCLKCIEEYSNVCHSITRPPQSWCYVEEIL